ncbi:MAG: hydroxyacid dehydrogenase [Candidatus Omnitrophica bacterium]|nr:hydroxyacid dehydrogenase [Candidatus Omnitrophota bacterium]MCM8802010.1 hydroxyacid dehydrogenase [Candidatus Omnitrophota bacterium]
MKYKIAIVNSTSFGIIYPEHIEKLKEFSEVERVNLPADVLEKKIIEQLSDFDGLIVGLTPYYSKNVLKNLKKLIVISRHGIADSNIDIKGATESNIIVCRFPLEIQKDAMAEYTVGLIILMARKLNQNYEFMKNEIWGKRIELVGIELKGKNAGLFGIGNVGTRVCEILKYGFGMNVYAYDPLISPEEIKRKGAIPSNIEEICKNCDIISFHCPLNEKTYNIIKEEEFNLMKDGIIIVNTSHRDLIDEKALIKYLKSGKIGGYAEDAIERRYILKENPLLKFKNVVIMPHLGRYTYETIKKMGDFTVENLKRIFVEKKFPDWVENMDIVPKVPLSR